MDIALDPSWKRLLETLVSPGVIAGLTVFSIALCAGSLLVASWTVRRLPPDYLIAERAWRRAHGATLAIRVLRNLLAFALLLLGLLMLVLPGQGLLTILAAGLLLDIPGKRRIEQRLMCHPRVLEILNRARRRGGHPPLRVPGPSSRRGGA